MITNTRVQFIISAIHSSLQRFSFLFQVITERIPVSIPDQCPKNMLLYPGDGSKSAWVCDCKTRFLYFPINDSCHEAYRQGPCPLHHFVALPEDNAVPRCEANPCFLDGVVPFNGTCHFLRSTDSPCGPKAILDVNETTFRLECISIVPFVIIDTVRRTCPPGSRRSTLGECKKVVKVLLSNLSHITLLNLLQRRGMMRV